MACWSSRIRAAALIGLISPRTYGVLKELRHIRNKAAHSEQPFLLQTYAIRLHRASDLGSDVSEAVGRKAIEADSGRALEAVLARGEVLAESIGDNVLQRPKTAAEHLGADHEVMAMLGERVW